jgi:cytochrome c oxidase subunit 2
MSTWLRHHPLCRLAVLIFVALMLAPLSGQELEVRPIGNIFEPHSTPAQKIADISWLVIGICFGIFVVVNGLLVYTIIRFRRRPTDDDSEPPQVYGSTQVEMAWTIIPILIVFVLALVTARTIGDIQDHRLPEGSLEVEIVGHQWWWEIRYPQYGFTTANELHVPVSTRDPQADPSQRRQTRLLLRSADVVHSYWVPQLAGKTDVVPNRANNDMWLEPWYTGIYLGNCAEYCGSQHAKMQIRVVVQKQEDFDRWVANEQRPAVDRADVKEGRDLFANYGCINCHSIHGLNETKGIPDRPLFGPDLTHLMSRETIGSCSVLNTPANLLQWVDNPQKLKPECLMPDMQLTDDEAKKITDYLLTLK